MSTTAGKSATGTTTVEARSGVARQDQARFPAGTAVRFLSIDAGPSRRSHSTVSGWNHPFPSDGEQFSPGTAICIAGGNGRVMLETAQNQSSGQIGVLITWFSNLL